MDGLEMGLAADEPAHSLGDLVSWGCRYYSEGDSQGTVGRGTLDPGSFAGACMVAWWDLDLKVGE